MDVGVGLRLGGVIAGAAVLLAATAAGGLTRNVWMPKIRKCDDRYCRTTESTLFVQRMSFADGTPHFARAFAAIDWDRVDACRTQNPGYWTYVFLSIRPQHSTRTWLVEATARSIDPRTPANVAVARCFQELFQQYVTDDLVSPDAIDAWQDTTVYIQAR